MVTQPVKGAEAPRLVGAGAPPVLGRSLLLIIGAAGIVIAGAGVRAASEIVAPIALALVLTIAVLPIAYGARRRGWPGWVGSLLSLTAACAIVLVLVGGLTLAAAKLVDVLPQYADDADRLQADSADFLTRFGLATEPATTAVESLDPERLTSLLTGLIAKTLEVLGNLFFLVTLLFFFCTAVPLLGARVATLKRAKPELAKSLARFVRATQRYLVVTAVFGAIVAVFDTAALWMLGVPLPLLWGLFSFITNFIPNIGFVVGVIPPALLALVSDGWGKAVAVVAVYSTLNVVIQTFIQPRYVGATVGLSAEMTFLSLVVWTFLLDPLGALLAVPLTLLVRAIFIDPDVRAAWISPLISTTAEDPAD